ncbi:MAG: C1 family peptidase [Clostridiales bacterium]|nr:C1 family peptidase [Clostridiales bacterium]
METNSSITLASLEQFEARFDAQRANRVAMNAVTENGLTKSAKRREAAQRDVHTFSVSLNQGDITNQKQSGRCWMFAALNTMRFEVIRKHKLSRDFELSQAYLFFYDKLEKSNYFLENVLETLDEPASGRLVSFLLQAPVGDGGQWDMLCNLVRKYGVVPKTAYPESVASSGSREMDAYLTEKLREDACILRKHYAAGADLADLRGEKEGMLEEIYRLLCICLGKPPKSFDFEYRDTDNVFHRDAGLTPQSFYAKYVGLVLDDYVSLINAPTADKPFGCSYTVRFLGNVKEGKPVRYLNLEIGELKKAAIAQLKDGEPVWFGCDVGKRSERSDGILDLDVYGLEDLLDTRFTMTKAERLDYGQSLMTHAMVFQGVNLDENGQPDRWRVENSWGKDPGKGGYYVMTDRWFDEYMYQVVVNKKYLTDEQLSAYNADPIELEPWDPMGSLAL